MVQRIDISVLGADNILVTFYLIFKNIFVRYIPVYKRDLFHKRTLIEQKIERKSYKGKP